MNLKRLGGLALVLSLTTGCGGGTKSPLVYLAKDSSRLERFCAAELRRYLYLTTGELVQILPVAGTAEMMKPGIILDVNGRLFPKETAAEPPAAAGSYRLETVIRDGRPDVVISAGEGFGILYGTYAFAEKLGVRFDLDGDVVPDERVGFEMPVLDETRAPLFARRGIQPFHDFPEGPDWWNEDDYKVVFGQLPKLRMNLFGLHTYPEKNPNAEPTVWIGLPGRYGEDGEVTESYPSSYQNTARANPSSHNWGFRPKKTGEFHFGAGDLFESDEFGPEVMAGLMPEPKDNAGSNALFNRTASMLKAAFDFGRGFGVGSVVGTETPLTVPAVVKERLKAAGLNPADPAVVKELYKGIFGRIAKAYPVDYYWLWTNENWTWSDADAAAVAAVTTDLAMAVEAAKEIRAPFGLATCGWVLGPPSRRTLFDELLPKTMPASAINREVGKAPVDPNFASISGRSKWAIPWLEDDPSLTSPQLWAGRMRRDAVDARRYGCDGLLGILWRTRILSPNVRALAGAAWDQSWSTVPPGFTDLAGPINGQYVVLKDASFAGAGAEAAVYRDARDRVTGYHLPVPPGSYDVTLKFCEGEFDRKGARVFDIFVQGKKLAERVDIFARAGKEKPYDLTFHNVAAGDGRLRIDFGDRVHYPSLAGLAVRGRGADGQAFVKNINCGGPRAGDYEADGPETPRSLDVSDLYADWAGNLFGRAAAKEIAAVFARIDGKLPIPVTWTDGPGGIVPDDRPWDEVRPGFAFVDELAALRPRIRGAGSLERFDYWLKSFETMRETARYRCLWGEYRHLEEKARAAKDAGARKALAAETLIPARVRMIGSLRAIMGALLATAGTPGELGTIANWEQHNMPPSIEKPEEDLREMLEAPLPPEALLPRDYEGPGRIIVPTARTALAAGEELRVKAIILSKDPVEDAVLLWRELGKGSFQKVPLARAERSVYRAVLPAPKTDIEYYIRARNRAGELIFPSTAPGLCRTVVLY
jgi:hypothetical protein